MAKVEPSLSFDHFSGKLSRQDKIVLRTRNGRTHAYAIMNPYTGPLAESRKQAISTFSQAVKQCKSEMSDPDRLAYWQDRYNQYTKAANKHLARANAKFIGTPASSSASANTRTSVKYYSTLRGFIIASLSAQLKAAG